jgi:hypothetical protein
LISVCTMALVTINIFEASIFTMSLDCKQKLFWRGRLFHLVMPLDEFEFSCSHVFDINLFKRRVYFLQWNYQLLRKNIYIFFVSGALFLYLHYLSSPLLLTVFTLFILQHKVYYFLGMYRPQNEHSLSEIWLYLA